MTGRPGRSEYVVAGGPLHPYATISEEIKWRGQVAEAGSVHYCFHDGGEAEWDKVWHPGAVCMLAVDTEHVWMVRQPRPAAGLVASLEIPAGKRDVQGEPELETAQRELAEELGFRASSWELVQTFFLAPGWTDEKLWLFLATGLSPIAGGATHLDEERLQIVRWPLQDLSSALAETQDAKTIIALQWLARNLTDVGARCVRNMTELAGDEDR
jgi:8-oxo-dGTP pyrophosphatase MutT (NUDIX family)